MLRGTVHILDQDPFSENQHFVPVSLKLCSLFEKKNKSLLITLISHSGGGEKQRAVDYLETSLCGGFNHRYVSLPFLELLISATLISLTLYRKLVSCKYNQLCSCSVVSILPSQMASFKFFLFLSLISELTGEQNEHFYSCFNSLLSPM